jgi:hypothetical protein
MDVNPFPQMREALRQQGEEAARFLMVARTELAALARSMADWDPTVEESVRFDGPCPFLTCLQTEPHDHPVCPDCGAVRWGNAYCETCRSHWPKERTAFRQLLEIGTEAPRPRTGPVGDEP